MKNILIVDDSATSRMLFKAYLPKDHEYTVREAHDIHSALDEAKEVRPDLVVLDYNMHEANGVEVAKKLLATGLNAKFALITANTQQYVIEDAKASGFFTVLEKPITREDIAALLEDSGI